MLPGVPRCVPVRVHTTTQRCVWVHTPTVAGGAGLQAGASRLELGGQVEALEVRMLDRLLWRDALLRIESHHLIHQVYRAFACIGYQLAKRRRHELRECETNFRRELVTFWPLCLSWTA